MIVVNGFSLSNCTRDFSHEGELRIGGGAVRIYDGGAIVGVVVLDLEAAKARGESGFECRPGAERIAAKAARAMRGEYNMYVRSRPQRTCACRRREGKAVAPLPRLL